MIFLTGGTGLLGLHILDELRDRSIAVTALVRDAAGSAAVAERGATPVQGSVQDPGMWAQVSGCTGIIHGAALIAGPHRWEDFLSVNVDAVRLAAERARELDVPLVHISSVAVYGRNYRGGEVIDESEVFGPLKDREYYARSKRMAEEVLWTRREKGLRASAIRPCVVYGEGDRLFLPRLVEGIRRRRVVPLVGKGDRPLALVHARNVAQVVVSALLTPLAWGKAYNAANDDEISAAGLVAAIEQVIERKVWTIPLPERAVLTAAAFLDVVKSLLGPSRYPGSVSSAARYWRGGNPFSSERARRELDWRPRIRHEEGIANAVRFILEHQRGAR
jgi:2-alkyl-3-oxoalkanoate reductase